MNSILVTGGGGFIGSHTCLSLLENGYRIYVVDTFENSSPEALERVKKILKAKILLIRIIEVLRYILILKLPKLKEL